MERISLKKVSIVGGIIALIVLAISGVSIARSRIYSATINVVVAPTDAAILLNETKISTGKRDIRPGAYTLHVSHEGFETEEIEFSVDSGEEKPLYVVLVSNDESTEDWYMKHDEDAKVLEAVGSISYDSAVNDLSKYSIMRLLPHTSATYFLGYGNCEISDGNSAFCLTVEAKQGYRLAAVEHLMRMDAQIGKYRIKFANYENPFREFSGNIPDNLTYENTLSYEELGTALQPELTAIYDLLAEVLQNRNVVEAPYAGVYQIKGLGDGNYCGITIRVGETEYDVYDLYRVLFGKINGNWIMLNRPSLVLTYADNPNLPTGLIDMINSF